jgi:hypothetical protein
MPSREYAKLTKTFPLSATRSEPLGPVRTIAVTGGKGGVGKTNVSANLAVALAGMGKRTLLLDADLGLANIDVILGLNPTLRWPTWSPAAARWTTSSSKARTACWWCRPRPAAGTWPSWPRPSMSAWSTCSPSWNASWTSWWWTPPPASPTAC